MVSLEVYNKLRGEINKLFANDENLLKDCSFSFLLSKPKDSKQALNLVRDLKEEGNTSFKQGGFDDALEYYGYAAVILARYEFVDEVRVEFVKLAISVLLNSSICLSKEKEFVQVGQICSIVLEVDSRNVKAMFRRAMAAIELGKLDWAVLDLQMAADIDPSNKEVSIKLEEVRSLLGIGICNNNQHQDATPSGLGIGLSSPKKRVRKSLGKENTMTQKEGKVIALSNCEECSSGMINSKENNSIFSNETKFTQENMGVDVNENMKEKKRIEDDKVVFSCKNSNTQDKLVEANMEVDVNENMKEKKRIEDDKDVVSCKNSNLAEPKYRFVDRRRPGSFISISRRDYQVLKKGKSIQCINSKLSYSMTIRAKLGTDDGNKKHVVRQEMDMATPTDSEMIDINLEPRDNKDENVENTLDYQEKVIVSNEVGFTSANSQHNHVPEIVQPEFRFSSSCITIHNRSCTTSARNRVKVFQRKARMDGKKHNSHVLSSHPFVVCRYHVGMKRKLFYHQVDSNQRLRKRLWFESSPLFESCCSSVMLSHVKYVARVQASSGARKGL